MNPTPKIAEREGVRFLVTTMAVLPHADMRKVPTITLEREAEKAVTREAGPDTTVGSDNEFAIQLAEVILTSPNPKILKLQELKQTNGT